MITTNDVIKIKIRNVETCLPNFNLINLNEVSLRRSLYIKNKNKKKENFLNNLGLISADNYKLVIDTQFFQ